MSLMTTMLLDWSDSQLHLTCCVIVLCPLLWNILGRLCYRCIPKKTPRYQRYIICYLLMLWIFSFSSYRDYLIRQTIFDQPHLMFLKDYTDYITFLTMILFLFGQIFVLSSFYKLGLTGTFLGDYCGILMDAPVRTFPFNILANPMYVGSTLSFFALTLYYYSPVGMLLTMEVYLVYRIALLFEEPYTRWIYEQKNK